MINPDFSNPGILRGLLEARRTQRDVRIQEATLAPEATLSPAEMAGQSAFYNETVGVLDLLKNGDVGDLKSLTHEQFSSLFPDLHGSPVEAATRHVPHDNPQAHDLRCEYRHRAHAAQRERKLAARLGGPGEAVVMERNGTVVTTTYNETRVHVQWRRPDGTTRTLSLDGARILDVCGDTITEFHVDPEGRPTATLRTAQGTITVAVNHDGSTERVIGGEVQHEAAAASPSTLPLDPWRTQPDCPYSFDGSFGQPS